MGFTSRGMYAEVDLDMFRRALRRSGMSYQELADDATRELRKIERAERKKNRADGIPAGVSKALVGQIASGAAYTGSQAYTLQVVMAQTYSGPSPTGSGTITATFSGGGATCVFTSARFIPLTGDAASPPANSAPPGVQFPHGLFDFATTGCTPGSTLQFTITYPSALPNGTQYWKYGPTPANPPAPSPRWYTLPAAVAGTVVTFTLTDGALGDDDLTANGAVVDAGGPGVGAATAVPVGDGLLWWLALGMLAVAAWQRRRGAA